ncbi:MAG: GyrI-like domain-containing protein [Thermoplasmata archaeon]|nr:GyrI-like domain-containing protein [Thermoplasmata archaeon]
MVKIKIETKREPPMRVASLMASGMPFQETIPRAFGDLAGWMASKGIPMPQGEPSGLAEYYDDPQQVEPDKVRFKVGVPVPDDVEETSEGTSAVETLPGCEVAYTTVYGPYDNLTGVYTGLWKWIQKKGYKVAGPPRELYVRFSMDMDPKEWVTEIQFPIER